MWPPQFIPNISLILNMFGKIFKNHWACTFKTCKISFHRVGKYVDAASCHIWQNTITQSDILRATNSHLTTHGSYYMFEKQQVNNSSDMTIVLLCSISLVSYILTSVLFIILLHYMLCLRVVGSKNVFV